MPDKVRRRKKKYSAQSKRKKEQSRPATTVGQQPSGEVVSSTKMAVPSASVPSPVSRPAAVQHPYIAAELRTIGILSGIMLVILAVLALVLT